MKDKTILAFNIYPKPHGINYYNNDLMTEKDVENLFDLCQILQAIIYQSGWEYLIYQFGFNKLFEINNRSGWFDSRSVQEYQQDVYLYITASK